MITLNLKKEFKDQVKYWAKKLEVEIGILAVRPMKRKWASCSTKNNLTFNTELLNYPPEVKDYVIIHELLHCYVPNHGRLWKSLMRAHLGNFESAEEYLKRRASI